MQVVEASALALGGLAVLGMALLGYYLFRFKPEEWWGADKRQFHRRMQRALMGLPSSMKAKPADTVGAEGARAAAGGAHEQSQAEPLLSEQEPAGPLSAEPLPADPVPVEAVAAETVPIEGRPAEPGSAQSTPTDSVSSELRPSSANNADRSARPAGPDRMYGEIVGGGLRVLGASVIGSSHEQAGQPREDAFSWRELTSGGLVTAIADGVGSTRHAHIAARLAAQYVVDEIAGHLEAGADVRHWPAIAHNAVGFVVSRHLQPEVVDDFAQQYSSYPVPPQKRERSPACTLLVTLFIPESDGLSVYWAAVGDSQLLSRNAQRSSAWRIETGEEEHAPRTRYVTNATESLPRDLRKVAVGHKRFESGTLLLLATDGFIRTLEVRSSPDDPFVTAEQLPSISSDGFFTAVDEPLPECWDDRTAVLIQTAPKDVRARPRYSWWGF